MGQRKQKGAPKRRALLIGLNYQVQHADSPDKLTGCVDDVDTLAELLMLSGWSLDDMMILTDNTKHQLPTRRNIISAAQWLVHDAQPGDVFWFSYSGHGSQEPDPHGYEEDGLRETILPLDVYQEGMICDDELNAILVRNLPSGCKLMALIDACHSGSLLNLPYHLTSSGWKEDVNPLHTKGDVQLFSGCKDSETSMDGKRGGAMTKSFVTTLRQNPYGLTYPELYNNVHRTLRSRGFWQRPVLSSSQRFHLGRPFVLDQIVPNANKQLGRTMRKRFRQKKPRGYLIPMTIALIVGLALGAAFGYFAQMYELGKIKEEKPDTVTPEDEAIDIVSMVVCGIMFAVMTMGCAYCFVGFEKMYPMLRYYGLKIPDIIIFWCGLCRNSCCPKQRSRNFQMSKNAWLGKSEESKRVKKLKDKNHGKKGHKKKDKKKDRRR